MSKTEEEVLNELLQKLVAKVNFVQMLTKECGELSYYIIAQLQEKIARLQSRIDELENNDNKVIG